MILINPATAKLAVDAAVQAYGFFANSGGAGIGNLIRAQSEMLRAISTKLDLLNERVELLYDKIDELREALDRLPSDVIRTHYDKTLRALIDRAQSELAKVAERTLAQGRTYALERGRKTCEQLVYDIRVARTVLMREETAAVLPGLCAAWFAELQLLANAVDYDPLEIRKSAEEYKKSLDTWLHKLDERITRHEFRAEAWAGALRHRYDSRFGYCYTNYDTDIEDGISWRAYRIRATLNHFTFEPHGIENQRTYPWRLPYQDRFDELRAAGVAVPDDFDKLWTWNWGSREVPAGFDGGLNEHDTPRDRAAKSRFDQIREAYESQLCNSDNVPRSKVEMLNAETLDVDKLQVSAIADYSFRLMCQATHESVQSIQRRLDQTAGSRWDF